MLKSKKHWFTLVEVVLACSIFAIVVVWIILAINRSFMFMNNTKLSVRAANSAREWVEMVYNIRDTNWRKYSGHRDKLWMYLGNGDIHLDWSSDNLFIPWVYIIKEWKSGGNSYLYAENLGIQEVNVNDFYSDAGFWSSNYKTYRDSARIMFCDIDTDGSCKKKNESCIDSATQYEKYYYYDENDDKVCWKVQDALIWEGLEFYRIVRVFGVYKKNVSSSDVRWTDETLRDWTPVEMRFCVKVFYSSQWKHSSEICSIMTNFMK